MKITIESTTKLVTLSDGLGGIFPGRIWEGTTESGIKVVAVITRIAVHEDDDQVQFERELKACRAPEMPDAFPLRMIL